MPADALDAIARFGIWYVVFLFTLVFHEGSHALVAHLGGDDTAYRGGQVTLNPWPHVRREPFGTVVIPLLTFFTSGWMMGWASAPYDPTWGSRHPRRLAAMSAAGPAANLALAMLAFVSLRALLAFGYFVPPEHVNFSHLVDPPPGTAEGSMLHPLALCLSVALSLNLLLGLFNLIPLPPLDGSGVVQGLFPDSLGRLVASVASNPMFAMLGLLAAWRVFDYVFGPAFSLMLALLHPGVGYSGR
jgi:Zn-dependent protease